MESESMSNHTNDENKTNTDRRSILKRKSVSEHSDSRTIPRSKSMKRNALSPLKIRTPNGENLHNERKQNDTKEPCRGQQGPSVDKLKGWLIDLEGKNKAHSAAINSVGTAIEALPGADAIGGSTVERKSRKSLPASTSRAINRACPVVATPGKKIKPRVKKEEVEATNDGYASVQKLSMWLADEGSRASSTGRSISAPSPAGATPQRLRFKPRMKKEEVEATNDTHASVSKLAEWLSDDPYAKQRLRCVRTGTKVIAKSRAFEPKPSLEVDIRSGNTHDRQGWLENAFNKKQDEASESKPSLGNDTKGGNVHDRQSWLKHAFDNTAAKKDSSLDGAEQANEVTESFIGSDDSDDSGEHLELKIGSTGEVAKSSNSSVSVSDRAKWLGSAFGKETLQTLGNRDEAENILACPKIEEEEGVNCSLVLPAKADSETNDMSEMPSQVEQPNAATNLNAVQKAADLFGGPVKPKSAVQRQREALERKHKEMVKRADPKGMLKTTWKTSGPSGARGAYVKKRTNDVAEKKALSDLP